MISRYTVHVDGRYDPIAVRDRLNGDLSEWEVVADVHVTAGDGRYDVVVDWDTTAPEWPDECWPMHAADALGRAAERVDGVTDAEVVCHDRPEPVVLEATTTPPQPPYELDRPGNRAERHGDALKPPTPTTSTPEPISPAHGHATAVKRPSPPPPDRWQLPPEPDVPQLQDATGRRWQRDPAGWTRVDEADDPTWRGWPWWRLLVQRGPLTAAPAARDAREQNLATLAGTGQQTAVRVPTLDEWED